MYSIVILKLAFPHRLQNAVIKVDQVDGECICNPSM